MGNPTVGTIPGAKENDKGNDPPNSRHGQRHVAFVISQHTISLFEAARVKRDDPKRGVRVINHVTDDPPHTKIDTELHTDEDHRKAETGDCRC